MNDSQSDYVFLSYSHKDSVSDLLECFESLGYNMVYDEVLSAGEEWNMRVRRYINNSRCKGVVCLASVNSVVSNAVLTEMDYTRLYNKPTFAIVRGGDSVAGLIEGITNRSDREVASFFAEYYPSNKIYVPEADLPANMRKITTAFEKWGFKPTSAMSDVVVNRYDTLSDFEKERLSIQESGYKDLDSELIRKQVGTFGRDGLLLVDLGCSDGTLTYNRFRDIPEISCIIGVDSNEKAIGIASERFSGDRFHFYRMDLNEPDFVQKLEEIVKDLGYDRVDIVFSALTLHHLKNPSLLLLALYDVLSEDGRVMIRESDDRGKNCHPEGELLSEFLDRYNALINDVTNRKFGRTLYKRLYDAGYVDIEMSYVVRDTCGMDRSFKQQMFKVGFGYRYNQLNRILADNPDNAKIAEEIDWQLKTLDRIRDLFLTRDFWYMNTTFVATAGVR